MIRLRRSLLRTPALILVGGLILATVGTLGTAFAIWSSRDVVLRQWQSRLSATTHMLAAHAVQTIDAADIMLRGIADNLHTYRLSSEAELQTTAASPRMYEMLREAMNGVPQVTGLSIISNDGRILNLTRQFPPPDINLSDQDYMRAFEDNPDLDFFIGRATINRLTQEPYFYLARPLKSRSGKKLGVIVTGLSSRFFSSFYQSAVLGDLRITIMRHDGAILARSSELASSFNSKEEIPGNILNFPDHQESGLRYIGGRETSRSFEDMLSLEHSLSLPISLVAKVSRAQILNEWEFQAIKFIFLGGGMSTLLIILTLILSRLVAQLEQARNSVLSAMEAKTRFATSISHELRTPMNAIVGGSHQLLATKLGPDAQQIAHMVASSAKQLTVLINDMLDFSYFEAREFRIEKAPFDPAQMAEIAMDMARALGSDSKLELVCRIDPQVPAQIIGDSGRIKQIILNLLGNAIKYTEYGKVELRVSYIRSKKNLLILQVKDTGPGIAAADQARIFEPFERTTAAKGRPGTGLGLTISKRLAEAMGGMIKLESQPGKGTHFTVEIPAPEAKQPVHLPDHQISSVPDFSKSLRILVAEDVVPSRMLLTMMLENLGHQVTAAENGLDALQAAHETAFDLILMDLQMPEMDGMTAMQRIRASHGPNQTTRILAVSANADMNGTGGLSAAGFDDALLKPITPERLKFVLSALTERG